jgi:inner membrane protein
LKTHLSFTALAVFFSLAVLSHPLLDMLTDGGSGAALFAPISNKRFFFPWQPIEVSPLGLGFFSRRGLTVFLSEFVWVWIPAMVILISAMSARKLLKRK